VKLKSDTGSGFSQIFDSGSERKTQNPVGVDSGTPVSSEISDFTPCTHAQSNIPHTKYVDKAGHLG